MSIRGCVCCHLNAKTTYFTKKILDVVECSGWWLCSRGYFILVFIVLGGGEGYYQDMGTTLRFVRYEAWKGKNISNKMNKL